MRTTWDIFCRVIDNFGDVGIAWRLARSLAREKDLAVRLWVDELGAFQRIWPAIDPSADEQTCEGVTVCAWREPFAPTAPGRVVIDAFGCTLPASYLAAMAEQMTPPVWLNLEYLSAEPWVAAHHGLPSPHPRLPLTRYFFFPGYAADTGGLLVEGDLAARRAQFLGRALPDFWRSLGVRPVADALRVSLFAYENPALPALLDAWAGGERRVTCLVPEGRILPQLAAWLDAPELHAGATQRRGALDVQVLPFLDQDTYDHLLWACDLNFVRGEDSCVRAQWAERPLVWQAYPQADAAHWAKLDALLGSYAEGLAGSAAQALPGLWRHWNGMPEPASIAQCWAGWVSSREALEAHAVHWRERLEGAGRLTDKLVEFVESKIK